MANRTLSQISQPLNPLPFQEDGEAVEERDEPPEKKKKSDKTAEELALEERKRAVEEELGEHLKERSKEHERHKYQEQEENFRALLVDLIKASDVSWHDARKQLRKDSRYEAIDLLDKETKENLFEEHVGALEKKRREAFFAALTDCDRLGFDTKWRDARKIIDEEERFDRLKASSERVCELYEG